MYTVIWIQADDVKFCCRYYDIAEYDYLYIMIHDIINNKYCEH